MTIDNLFGPEKKRKPLRLKVIRPIYESIKITEAASQYINKTTPLSSSTLVADMFSFLHHETKEHFIALHLNSKNRLLCLEIVSTGSLNASIVHPREVYKAAIRESAAAILAMHNHPSGDPSPSKEDYEVTLRLKEVGDLVGISLLDHIILGERRYVSFREHRLIAW